MSVEVCERTIDESEDDNDVDSEYVSPFEGQRDGWLDVQRCPASDNARALCQYVLESSERRHGRQRARKAVHRQTYTETLSCAVCGLARAVLKAKGGEVKPLVVPRSNKVLGKASRYRPQAHNQQLPKVLDALEKDGWITQCLGERNPFIDDTGRKTMKGASTTIAPTEKLRRAIAESGVSLLDIRRLAGAESIVLKAVKQGKKAKLAEYVDTDETIRMRRDMAAVNALIEEVHLDLEWQTVGTVIDLDQRALHRTFSNGDFSQGGRMYGGFWINMKKEDREAILIDGEDTVEVDYGQMALHLAYGMAGHVPPGGDLYDIPGLTYRHGQNYREGVKRYTNALMFKERLSRKPKGTGKILPFDLSSNAINDMILERHKPIAHLLDGKHGFAFQRAESDLMIDVILRLGSEGIITLPIHDCLICRTDERARVKRGMEGAFKARYGFVCPAS